MSRDFDIAVIGGGPTGAATAALLARHVGLPAARIALLAPELAVTADATSAARPGPTALALAGAAAPDLRVVALSRASENVLQHAGAWQRLDAARLCAYERMRVWHESVPADGAEVLQFEAAELAEPNLGYIAEQRALTSAATQSFHAAGGVTLACRVVALNAGTQHVELATDQGAVRTRLVIGADGAHSAVREWLRIEVAAHDYQQSAIVATLSTTRAHQHTAWQRFLGSGPLALLPLYDGSSSIVWSAADALARELLALTPAGFAERLGAASDHVLGDVTLVSERVAVPLRRATALSLVGERAVLLGDAAHVVHPLAGQGLNLALLDAAALVDVLAAGLAQREDPGAARLLRRYEQARYTHNVLMSAAMSAFGALFARGPGPAGWVAARLLGLAGASAVVRGGLARRALGLSGELPRLARAAAGSAAGGNLAA